ncbi:MAG: hypothetical protein IT220_07795 [Flavobacteriaceae bacterium]|nr:hypothetical protein [Flavobacteriaceae bacterium]
MAVILTIAITIFIGTPSEKRTYKQTNKETETIILKRILNIYENDSVKSKTVYELKIIERDSVRIYKYINPKDSTRNINFRYFKWNKNVISGPFEYKLSISNYYQSKLNFDKYEPIENMIDGPGLILFNQTYGILAWGDWYFLNSETISEVDLPILK